MAVEDQMTKTTKLARQLADRAEDWADKAGDSYNAAYDLRRLKDRDSWFGAAVIAGAYALASIARMFTEEDQ